MATKKKISAKAPKSKRKAAPKGKVGIKGGPKGTSFQASGRMAAATGTSTY